MRHNILTTIRRAAILAVLTFTAACNTDVTAPVLLAPTEASAARGTVTVGARASTEATVRTAGHLRPLRRAVTYSAVIGKGGGTLRIPETGFELVVPAGATESPITFTATALAGPTLAYEFGPHGMQFKKALKFRQSVLTTSIGWGQKVMGGYFTHASKIDPTSKKATVAEQMPASIMGTWVVFDIWHFSGYLVSCA